MSIYDASVIAESKKFIGTENYYKHTLCPIIYTDGVKWLAETLECHWLIDDIAIFSHNLRKSYDFLTITFTSTAYNQGVLVFEDGNNQVLLRKKYTFCDLRTTTESLRFYLTQDGGFNKQVLLLPSEY